MDRILQVLSGSPQNHNVTSPGQITTWAARDPEHTILQAPALNNNTVEDETLLQAGRLYQTWCHNQPVDLFRQEGFLSTLRGRDEELLLSLKLLNCQFPPEQVTPEGRAALRVLSQSCRRLVRDRIDNGKIRLSTLQALCLLSMTSFSDGQVMQAGLDLDTALYFANGIPSGSFLGDPLEFSLCMKSISILQSLQGPIPDVAKPTHPQSSFHNTKSFLELLNHRAERFPLVREPSDAVGSNDNGILTYMDQAAKVWYQARAYASTRVGPDSPPPWSTHSDYALVSVSPDELMQRRDYWGAWILIQFMHAAIPTLINHPFLLSLRLKSFRHMIPQTFMYQSFDLISKHTAWIICYLDLVEKQQFQITDPTIAHAVVIVATIHLQHSFVADEILRTKAQHCYDKCMRFLDNMGSFLPVVFTMTHKLRRLQESITTVLPRADRIPDTQPSWSIDAQLLWDLLVYERSVLDEGSADTSMYDDIITPSPGSAEETIEGNISIVGSAGISGHKGALKQFSAYAPQDRNPYEILGTPATTIAGSERWQDDRTFGRGIYDGLPDFGQMDQDNFLLQAEDFGRAMNDWMNLDMTDVL
ncbi:hypothetical protein NW762_012689 [Fusarium torreyae]|uniref:Transcription factor domain-containing protein n=1 Tax=Fusarium torreyae TaxID=1237075 RepID=A0A9W8RLT2_9HYPO|nr:hypothetical protein NW762_012689 [Fusarium torreyae]